MTAPPPQVIVQQQTTALGRYGKFVLVLLVLAVLVIFGMASAYRSYFSAAGGPQEKFHSLNRTATKKIAIVDISGSILSGEGFEKDQLDRIEEDDQVVSVVLRINSPGGTVTGSDYLYHYIRKLREKRDLPVVVSMGSICASGGYYIAMAVGDQEDSIFAEPTTWTGSIGVVIPRYDFSEMLQHYNIKDDSVASHKHKLMGSPTRHLPTEERAEERELLQNLVNLSFDRFKEVVLSGRPKFEEDPDAFDGVLTGQIFTANQAVDNGLVDRVGFIEEAIERAAELAGHDLDDLRCVKFEQPPTLFGGLLRSDARAGSLLTGELQAILDLATPRAYFIFTHLPAMLQNTRP